MKIHLGWIRVTAIAAIVAGASASPVAAQYAPYRPLPKPVAPVQQTAAQPVPQTAAQPVPATAQPPYNSAYWPQAAQPRVASRYAMPATTQYPQTTAPYVPATAAVPQTTQTATPQYPTATQYPASGYPSYPDAAQNEAPPAPPEPNGLPAPEAPSNGAAPNGANGHANGHVNGQANGHANGYSNGAAVMNGTNGDCGCANGYTGGSYYNGDASCDSGSHSLTSYFDNPCHDSQWFGGVYFLWMERDRPSPEKVTVAAADAATYPYHPTASTTVLVAADHDFREGVEVRLGSTFSVMDSCDSCDGCGPAAGCSSGCNSCSSCGAEVYAWEVAWWGLDDDPIDLTYVDQATTGLFGMKNFAGLGYDRDGDAAIDNPVNGYYGYALPIPAASSEILAQRVRTNFKAQNLELNLIKFPVCSMGCGGCSSGCNGCDSGCGTAGGYGGNGYADCGCEEHCCPSLFTMYGSCGVRYFRADDDFMYATEFNGGTQAAYDGWSYDDDNELYYDVQVDNHLIGPQVGWTMNYSYACRWNFFCNSTFGLFNNHIEQNQRMWSGGGGTVYFYDPATGGTGEQFDVESDKDDISFLGELRLGGSYDITCNWRAVLAYRAVAVTGIATSTDNIPSDFTNPEWVGIIDSDNSLIVHGVQAGGECRY